MKHLNKRFNLSIFPLLFSIIISLTCSNKNPAINNADKPTSPSNVQIKAGDTKIILTWDSTTEADSYNLYWANNPKVTTDNNRINDVKCPFEHSGLENGKAYYYRLAARNENGESDLSNEVSATPVLIIDIPEKPKNIKAMSGDKKITITWDTSAEADIYNIYWADTALVDSTSIKITDATRPYEHSGLTNGETYYYRVSAQNSAGESELSTMVNATPDSLIAMPEIPKNVKAVAGDKKVIIAWDSAAEVDTYNIYWADSALVDSASIKFTDVTRPFEHTGLTNGETYYYRVSAKNSAGESELSLQVNATPISIADTPDVPTNILVTSGNTKVIISWDSSASADSYNIYWADSSVVNNASTKINNVLSPFEHIGLTNGTTYYYRVSAYNSVGESELSITKHGTPTGDSAIPNPPTNIKVYERDSLLTLTWDPVSNATLYNVYWSYEPDVNKQDFKEIATSTPFDFINLKNGTTYYLRISSRNSIGEGQLSKEVSGTPKKLLPPEGVSIDIKYKQMRIIWNRVSNASWYNIYWDTLSAVSTSSNRIVGVVSPHVHDSLNPLRDYYYRVVSANPFEESMPSFMVNGYAGLTPPTALTTDSAYRQIILDWDNVNYATSYKIYWDTISNVTSSSNMITCSTTAYTHSDLELFKTYYYRISAKNSESVSKLSQIVSSKVKALAPTANAGRDTIVGINDTIYLHGKGTDSNGSIEKYEWKFGSNNWVETSKGDTLIIAPSTTQDFFCRFRVTDNDGLTDEDVIRIAVTSSKPTANAGKDTTVSINDPINLHGIGTDSDGKIEKYEWRFGTSNWVETSTGDTTITAPGTNQFYICSLRVTDDDGLSDHDHVTIIVGLPTITDIDGNVYNTIVLGEQVWTVQNLRTTRYNDGTTIPHLVDNRSWQSNTTGAYSYYENTTDTILQQKLGPLYNWYAVNTGKLAPEGWHIPTVEDWEELRDYLIANGYNWDGTTSGNKVSQSMAAQADWLTTTKEGAPGYNPAANNRSGLTGLPCGYRVDGGGFLHGNSSCGWWSDTELNSTNARHYLITYGSPASRWANQNKGTGHSIRLTKDKVLD